MKKTTDDESKFLTREEILTLDLNDLHVKRSSEEENKNEESKFIDGDITLEEPLTYSRED
ncbi:MAG TPA: hypothetical protein EYG83_03590 [Sulfurospirillum arcachonense]|nr:hypothetical protein [Sulfurospirillum arcachonense]